MTPATVQAVDAAQREGRSVWRVSSTLFAHVASDALLQPLINTGADQATAAGASRASSSASAAPPSRRCTADDHARYPPLLAGEQVQRELAAIRLSRDVGPSGGPHHATQLATLAPESAAGVLPLQQVTASAANRGVGGGGLTSPQQPVAGSKLKPDRESAARTGAGANPRTCAKTDSIVGILA